LLLILIWSLPVIWLQWLVAGDVLISRWKLLLPSILLASIYLTSVDAVALNAGLWALNPALTTGWVLPILGTPIEGAVFYLTSSTLTAQTLVLLVAWPFMRQRLGKFARLILRGGKPNEGADPDQPPPV
jgi:lycopene cyclase domain-containing protein